MDGYNTSASIGTFHFPFLCGDNALHWSTVQTMDRYINVCCKLYGIRRTSYNVLYVVRSTICYFVRCILYVIYFDTPFKSDIRCPFSRRLEPNQLGRPKINVAIRTKKKNQPQNWIILIHARASHRLPHASKSTPYTLSLSARSAPSTRIPH